MGQKRKPAREPEVKTEKEEELTELAARLCGFEPEEPDTGAGEQPDEVRSAGEPEVEPDAKPACEPDAEGDAGTEEEFRKLRREVDALRQELRRAHAAEQRMERARAASAGPLYTPGLSPDTATEAFVKALRESLA